MSKRFGAPKETLFEQLGWTLEDVCREWSNEYARRQVAEGELCEEQATVKSLESRIAELEAALKEAMEGAQLAKRAGGVMRRIGLGLVGDEMQIELRDYYDKITARAAAKGEGE